MLSDSGVQSSKNWQICSGHGGVHTAMGEFVPKADQYDLRGEDLMSTDSVGELPLPVEGEANLSKKPQKEVFISYAHKDHHLAGMIGHELQKFGLAIFLAHENIEVSTEWRTEIRNHLNSCSSVIAIVTENFGKSIWTQQEVGIALGMDKPVVPLIVGAALEVMSGLGFIESLQGVKLTEASVSEAIKRALIIVGKSRPPAYVRLKSLLADIARDVTIIDGLSEGNAHYKSMCKQLTEEFRTLETVMHEGKDEISFGMAKEIQELLADASEESSGMPFSYSNTLRMAIAIQDLLDRLKDY